ncbi:MAG: hypothetical protein IJ727_00170, partial [Treponema sp.]|nr:hypothetical protein [Treponema sp.]
LEDLAAAQEAKIAQALKVKAGIATEILLAARAALEKRNETKNPRDLLFKAQLNLKNEEESDYTSELAKAALE